MTTGPDPTAPPPDPAATTSPDPTAAPAQTTTPVVEGMSIPIPGRGGERGLVRAVMNIQGRRLARVYVPYYHSSDLVVDLDQNTLLGRFGEVQLYPLT